MTQFTERLGLNLTNTLTSYIEFLSHFLKGSGPAVIKSEPELENLLLSFRQSIQYLYQLLKTLDLHITSVEIALARRAVGSRKVKLGAEQRFQSTNDKVWFLKMMMQKALGVPVTVTCVVKLEEYHNITLQNKHFTLKILTTDGISYWWRGRIAKKIPEIDKLKEFPLLDMELKN